MWMKEEIDDCRALYDNIPKLELRDILEDDEFELIGEKPIAFANLKDRPIIPKRYTKPTTVTFQRLWNDTLDFDKWLNQIADVVWFSSETHVRVGFSFICWKPTTGEKIYIWAAKGHAAFDFFCDTKEECLANFSKFGSKSMGYLLEKTFIDQEDENDPFTFSGYCPLKLVSTYVWIRK